MRVALRISLIYVALMVALGVAARLDTLSVCSEGCQVVAFCSALAYHILMLPGLRTVGLLVPYNVHELPALTIVREVLSLTVTALIVFGVTLLLARWISNARASRQA